MAPVPEPATPTLAYGNLADRPNGSFAAQGFAVVFLIFPKIGATHPRPLLQDDRRTGPFTFKTKSLVWRWWAQGMFPFHR